MWGRAALIKANNSVIQAEVRRDLAHTHTHTRTRTHKHTHTRAHTHLRRQVGIFGHVGDPGLELAHTTRALLTAGRVAVKPHLHSTNEYVGCSR